MSPLIREGRMASWAVRCVVLGLALASLAACGEGDTRKILGLDKKAPDEFKIVSRAPLSLPPDYSLRPPTPGAVRPQEQAIPQRALAAVTGAPSGTSSRQGSASASTGENALLAHLGTDRSNPNIREILERDTTSLADEDTTFMDRLMFWRAPDDRSPVVDAQRESQRLRENASLGRQVNEGDTPTIRRRKKALLEGLF
jgi:hypothetical protein